jgi:hypothetical protein
MKGFLILILYFYCLDLFCQDKIVFDYIKEYKTSKIKFDTLDEKNINLDILSSKYSNADLWIDSNKNAKIFFSAYYIGSRNFEYAIMNFPENLVEGKEYSIAFDIMLINEEKTFGFKKMDLKLIDDNYTSINYKNKVNIVQNPDTTFVFKGVNDLVSVNYKFRYNRKLKSFIIGYMMDKGINDTLFFQDLDRIMKMSKKRYSRTSNFNYVLMRNHSEKIEIDLDYSFDYGISNLKIFEQ